MSKKEDDAYAKWLGELKGNMTAEQAAALDGIAESDALRETFRGTIREKDYYTKLNTLNEDRKALESEVSQFDQQRQNLYNWFEAEKPKNQQLMESNAELQRQLKEFQDGVDLDDPPNRASATDQSVINRLIEDQKALREQLIRQDRALPKFMADFGDVIDENAREAFGITPSKIIDHVIRNNVDARTAFMDLTREQRAERAEEERLEAIENAKKEAREEAQAEFMATLSSPDKLRPVGPTPIMDQITSPTNEQFGTAAAVEEFMKTGGKPEGQ